MLVQFFLVGVHSLVEVGSGSLTSLPAAFSPKQLVNFIVLCCPKVLYNSESQLGCMQVSTASPVGLLDLVSECNCQLPARRCPPPCICVCDSSVCVCVCMYVCECLVCRGLTSWLVCSLQHLLTKLCAYCVSRLLCPLPAH